jgi:hypothetical protein
LFIPLTRGDDGKYVIPSPHGGGAWQQIGDRLVQVEEPTRVPTKTPVAE